MKGLGFLVALLVMLVAGTVNGQCPGGVCTPASRPVKQVLKKAERSVLVTRPFAEVKRARTVQRTGRRFVLFRRTLSR